MQCAPLENTPTTFTFPGRLSIEQEESLAPGHQARCLNRLRTGVVRTKEHFGEVGFPTRPRFMQMQKFRRYS